MFSLASLPSILQKTAIILFILTGHVTFRILFWTTAGSREAMPLTFVEIFMTYGRQLGLQMLGLGRCAVDIAKTVMDFAADVGYALYAVEGDAGSTQQSDVELGNRIDSGYSSAEVSTKFFSLINPSHLPTHQARKYWFEGEQCRISDPQRGDAPNFR